MKSFIECLFKQLVLKPNFVEVTSESDTESKVTVYKVKISKEDMGFVIGKEGATIKAIRTVAKSAAIRAGEKIRIDLLEPEGSDRR